MEIYKLSISAKTLAKVAEDDKPRAMRFSALIGALEQLEMTRRTWDSATPFERSDTGRQMGVLMLFVIDERVQILNQYTEV